MITIVLLLAALLLVCAVYTFFQVRRIETTIKPDGSFASVDGARLHYHFYPAAVERPDQPVLVFLHGASGNAYDPRLAFLETLKGKCPLLFVDRPGLGFSDADTGSYERPEDQAKVLARLLEKLEIGNAVVVGHSYGGAVAAALGLAAPDRVTGLAFLSPVSHVWPGGVNWYYNVAALPGIGSLFCWTLTLPVGYRLAPNAMANVFFPDPAIPDYPEKTKLPLLFRPHTFRANARQIASLKPAIIEQSERYGDLCQPALIVTGTEDQVVWPSIHCEGLLRDLPDAELVMLDRVGHMPHLTHTDIVVRALEDLMARVESRNETELVGSLANAAAAN
ncbi:alpha/beta fold hydrolase [Roseibium sp. MMSF_3544]|uniref:alpha/beta fold hydrolase n=1 Tax=unclassified Roseibium TaxID=2629323 RepID=UPI00273E401D|nr:alpha/beta hydrolase [Roseibium sp. MMSF_3544]